MRVRADVEGQDALGRQDRARHVDGVVRREAGHRRPQRVLELPFLGAPRRRAPIGPRPVRSAASARATREIADHLVYHGHRLVRVDTLAVHAGQRHVPNPLLVLDLDRVITKADDHIRRAQKPPLHLPARALSMQPIDSG